MTFLASQVDSANILGEKVAMMEERRVGIECQVVKQLCGRTHVDRATVVDLLCFNLLRIKQCNAIIYIIYINSTI